MNSLNTHFKPDLDQITMADAIIALREGHYTSTQLVQAYIAKAQLHTELNAFVTLDIKGALQAAQTIDQRRAQGQTLPPLAGIPIVVKDNIHVQGLACTAGSPAFADHVPALDAPTVAKLRQAGAIILGKTNMHELAFGATGYNQAYNTSRNMGVRNAYNHEHIAGGSSSGSAAALGARLALGALGTDTGGSMRIPPALNGCAALRPSAGRYSGDGVIPIAKSRDTVGPMALSMADLIVLDGILTEQYELPNVSLGQLRLGLPTEFWQNLDEDTATLAHSTVETLKNHGVTFLDIEEADLHRLNAPVGFSVVIAEAYSCMQDYLAEHAPHLTMNDLAQKLISPDVKMIYEQWVLPQKMPTAEGLVDVAPLYEAAQSQGREQLRARYQYIFDHYQIDALFFPTTAIVAPLANETVYQPENFERLIQNTEPSASVGLPSIQLPVGLGALSGLPVGMELDAPFATDRRLLAIGQLLESVLGRIQPPIYSH